MKYHKLRLVVSCLMGLLICTRYNVYTGLGRSNLVCNSVKVENPSLKLNAVLSSDFCFYMQRIGECLSSTRLCEYKQK
jgi:hypothetical protein